MHLRVTLAAVATLALAASPAVAKPKPVTGTLSKPGYTVIALDYSGRAALSSGGKALKIVPTAKVFTLQLRDKKGDYAGPIVALGAKKTVVITGFRAGAKLGRIVVKKGYAVIGKLPRSALDPKRTALAKSGRPIGVGKLGDVKTASKGPVGPGLDPDRDGLPGSFDTDDDGDTLLDNVDRPPAHASCCVIDFTDVRHAMWLMNIGLEQSYLAARSGVAPGAGGFALNTHAKDQFQTTEAFRGLVDTAMKQRGSLLFPLPSLPSELDCTGLPFCTVFNKSTDMSQKKRFPADFDADGNGFGSMTPVGSFNPANDGIGTPQMVDPNKVFGMKPAASSAEIHSGQTVLERAGGGSYPVMLNMVFQTVPALARWGDESGIDGTGLNQTVVSYPVPSGGPGSQSNPIVLHPSNVDGDYWLDLQIWRPQRYSPADNYYIDIGWLQYMVVGRTIGPNSQLWHCPFGSYRTMPQLDAPGVNVFHEQYLTQNGIVDDSFDGGYSNAWTLTFAVNLSACQRASGIGLWNDGNQTSMEVSVAAISDYGDAAEGVGFAFRPAASTAGAGSSTWNFAGGTPSTDINFKVHVNADGMSKFRIQFHEATPIQSSTAPGGFTCSPVTVSNPSDALECTRNSPSAPFVGSDLTGSLKLKDPGHDGMPVDLVSTYFDKDYPSNMTQG